VGEKWLGLSIVALLLQGHALPLLISLMMMMIKPSGSAVR
jgi:hypothetical protein